RAGPIGARDRLGTRLIARYRIEHDWPRPLERHRLAMALGGRGDVLGGLDLDAARPDLREHLAERIGGTFLFAVHLWVELAHPESGAAGGTDGVAGVRRRARRAPRARRALGALGAGIGVRVAARSSRCRRAEAGLPKPVGVVAAGAPRGFLRGARLLGRR